ncbi:translocation/assembly module TamB, partial [Flavobacteriaceae bacterium]|nr:translocation/assembly module TamB [Flavobacteriaceae bacterium]
VDSNFSLKNLNLSYGNSNLEGDFLLDFSRIRNLSSLNTNVIDSVFLDFKIRNSNIFPSDFSNFYNKINKSYSEIWKFKSDIKGFVNELIIENSIFSNQENLIKFESNLTNVFNKERDYSVDFNFETINISSGTLNSIFPEIFGTIIPSSIKTLGKFKFDGYVLANPNEVKSKFNLRVQDGLINAYLNISDLSNIDNAKYNGFINGNDIDVSRFINFKSIGKSNFKFDIKGRGFTSEYLNSTVTGKIDKISLNNQILNELDIFGIVKNQVFDGKLKLNDPNLNLEFNGLIDFSNDLIDFDFDSKVKYANLFNLGFNDRSELNGDIIVKLRGNNMEDLIGDLSLKKIKYKKNNQTVEFQDLFAQLRNNEGNRIFNISSDDIVSGILIGEYDFINLKSSILNNFGSHYSNYRLLKPIESQNISFNLNFKSKFLKLINNNLSIDENTFLKGKFESNGNYEIKLESSFVNYKDIYATNLNLDINNKSGFIHFDEIKSKLVSGKDFKLLTEFKNDSLKVNSSYKSSKDELNKISFSHTIDKKNNSVVSFYDMELIINNQKWFIDKNENKELPLFVFSRNKKDYSLINANLSSGNQYLDLNISEDSMNSIYSLGFNNVSLENFTSKKDKIFFQALVNGRVELIKNNDEYKGTSSLKIENIRANNNLIGSGNLNINASNDLKSFMMSFDIVDNSQKILDLNGKFSIEQDYYPLEMKLKMKDFAIKPFSKLGDNVITNFKGFFNSEILISGNSKSPNFNGKIETKDVEFLIPYLNVNYALVNNPSFNLINQTFELNDFSLYDSKTKSIGTLNGKINHKIFKDWYLDLDIETNNLLILDTDSNSGGVYYGLGFLNGQANIIGPGKDLFIDVKGSTNIGTVLTIPIKKSKNTGDLSYLNFITDKDDNSVLDYKTNGLKVNLDLVFKPEAKIEVILDPESGSKLVSNGNGNLNFKINTVGNFNIFGDYTVDSGSYFYKALGIVDREFILEKGSSIVWSGNPYTADLNINANYEIPGGANPAILIQNTSFNRKIPTNIDVNLTGNLIEMNTPNFNINFPNTSGPIKSEIEYYLVDEEKKQKQAISLLYQSTFIDEISLSSVSSQAITNNLFQKASGIIDDIFTNSDDKMNVGINYLKGDKNAASSLLNRDRLGLTLKTEISDKILINGKIGVPVGGVEENVIIGDVQIEFLLNEEGNFKARFFNKENEYQYFANDIGYTQGMGISYELEFDSFKELFKKKKNKVNSNNIK